MKRQPAGAHAHRDPVSGKIEFFTPTQIDSIPKDHRYNSMLNRKTLPGGKQLPKTVAYTSGDPVQFKSSNIKQSNSPAEQ